MDDESNINLMMVLSMLAFAVENDEVFNVRQDIYETILKSMIANDTVPELSVDYADERIKIGVRLVDRKEVEDESK